MVVNDISHFDPTGILLNGTGIENTTENRFKWQGKESLELFGLSGVNDFLARYADKTINRFWGVDALSEQMANYSPYSISFNNPLSFIDPDGNEAKNLTNLDEDQNPNIEKDPPSLLQKILNFFGFFKQPDSAEEAQVYAERQEKLEEISNQWKQVEEKVIDKTEYVPLLGTAAKMSKAIIEKDNTGVVTGSIMFAVDATGIGGLTKTQWGWEGTKVWKNLVNSIRTGGTFESLLGKTPTKDEAIKLIQQAGGRIERIEGGYLPPNPYIYDHINYTTPSGGKGTIKIQSL